MHHLSLYTGQQRGLITVRRSAQYYVSISHKTTTFNNCMPDIYHRNWGRNCDFVFLLLFISLKNVAIIRHKFYFLSLFIDLILSSTFSLERRHVFPMSENLAKLELQREQIHVRSEKDEEGAPSGGDALLQALMQAFLLPLEGFSEIATIYRRPNLIDLP